MSFYPPTGLLDYRLPEDVLKIGTHSSTSLQARRARRLPDDVTKRIESGRQGVLSFRLGLTVW